MGAKKKIILIVSAILVIVIASVGVLYFVLQRNKKATTDDGQPKEGVEVVFNTTKVNANVKAEYTNASYANPVEWGTITFNEDKTQGTLTKPNKLHLTNAYNYIEFIFSFTNENTEKAYTAEITLPEICNNFTTEYTVPTGDNVENISNTKFKVKQNTTEAVSYKVRFTVADLEDDARLFGSFSWNLVSD